MRNEVFSRSGSQAVLRQQIRSCPTGLVAARVDQPPPDQARSALRWKTPTNTTAEFSASRHTRISPYMKKRWPWRGKCYGIKPYNTVFMGVQQLATLAVHKRFFVGDHVLPVAIRFEECFCPGDVIEPNLRDTVKVGGCCPW